MPGQFTASVSGLRSVAEFLEELSTATQNHGVQIFGSFTVQLPGQDGSTIEASWDEESCEYVLSDQVGA